MPNYFHTKSFYIFVGLFELLLGLYYLILNKTCPIPSCPPDQHITLAKLLIFSGIVSLSANSFPKNLALHFFLSLFASFPLFLLSIPLLATHSFLEGIPLGLMAIGLLIAPFLPKNVFSQKESFLLTIVISLILIFCLPLFLFGNERIKNSPMLVLLSVLALTSITVFQIIKKSYSIKSSLKSLPVFKKIAMELESLSWVSVFIMLLTIIQSQLISPSFYLPYILISIISIFIVIYFNFLPQSFYNEKSLLLAVFIYNIFILLIIFVTGNFTSPLNYLLVIPLLVIAVYLPRKYIFLSLAIDIEFFLNFILLNDLGKNSLVLFVFNSSLLSLIALIIYKTLEIKDVFIRKT